AKTIKIGGFDAIMASASPRASWSTVFVPTHIYGRERAALSYRHPHAAAPSSRDRSYLPGCTGSDGRTSLTLPLANTGKFVAGLETFWRRKKGPSSLPRSLGETGGVYGTRTRGLRRDRQRRGCGSQWQDFATLWNDWNSAGREFSAHVNVGKGLDAESYT